MKKLSELGKWVPPEATEGMLDAAADAGDRAREANRNGTGDYSAEQVVEDEYASLLRAAPTAPTVALERVVEQAKIAMEELLEATGQPSLADMDRMFKKGKRLGEALAALEAALENK